MKGCGLLEVELSPSIRTSGYGKVGAHLGKGKLEYDRSRDCERWGGVVTVTRGGGMNGSGTESPELEE